MGSLTRIHGDGYREAIAIALRQCGPTAARLGHVQFVCGVDPVFAGLHRYETTVDGRSYRSTSHCAYRHHIIGPADRRATTIIVPDSAYRHRRPWAFAHELVHELGHALHETIGYDHRAEPVTEYAKRNSYEAFAEAFTSWRWPTPDYARPDERTLDLFRRL